MNETPTFNLEETEIGIHGDPPLVVVLTIPIAKYAADEKNGAALVYGKIREAQAEVLKLMTDMRRKKAQTNGIVMPKGPLGVI